MIGTLFSLGSRILETFSNMVNFMNTNGAYINGQFFTITEFLVGGGLTVLMIFIVIKFVVSIIP